eukprot:gb/GECG01003948.1/.p1 GENE.gb/GECG01003948.1/~~gb/GECG01003948.1/.p1  ORF type:complete len:214 (+),score=31.04 gb/GECG01003948.1/:1-642(+)
MSEQTHKRSYPEDTADDPPETHHNSKRQKPNEACTSAEERRGAATPGTAGVSVSVSPSSAPRGASATDTDNKEGSPTLGTPWKHLRDAPIPNVPPGTGMYTSQDSNATGKRHNYLSWDDYFMSVTFLSAMRSKDPSTQVGACIVNNKKRIVGIGYNGFPMGCSDDALPWARRSSSGGSLDTKYPVSGSVVEEFKFVYHSDNFDRSLSMFAMLK